MKPYHVFALVLLSVIIGFIIIFSKATPLKETAPDPYMPLVAASFEHGKSVGRNGMLLYLQKTGQLPESTKLDLYYLLKIEDSLTSIK